MWPHWVAGLSSAVGQRTWGGGRLDYERLNSEKTRRVWAAPARSSYQERVPFVDSTYGCNCGFLRSMWAEIGGFDTRISGTGGDETELFMRAWGAGYTRVDAETAIVSYRLRPGFRNMLRQRFRQGRNQVLLRSLPGGRLLPGQLTFKGELAALGYRLLASPKYLWSSSKRCVWAASIALHSGRLIGLYRRWRGQPWIK